MVAQSLMKNKHTKVNFVEKRKSDKRQSGQT